MNRKRILAIGKLVLLFGAPLVVIAGLFSCGVYCGVENRAGIKGFERDFLGFDVEVPGEPAKAGAEAKAPVEAKVPAEAKAVEPASPTVDPTPAPVAPVPAPAVVPPSTSGGVPAPFTPPAARVDPLDEALAARLHVMRVVRVKVLVDQSLIDEHPDWIDYVQRTVSRASQIYQEQFGIALELAGVGRWPVASEGMGTEALVGDLAARPREAADVLLGLTSRAFDGAAVEAHAPAPGDPFNGRHAVVYATPGHREGHVRTLLHEVAHLFGASDVADPLDPAHISGSWMSYAVVPELQAPWIDPVNRKRVLERKDLPFGPDTPILAEEEPTKEGS